VDSRVEGRVRTFPRNQLDSRFLETDHGRNEDEQLNSPGHDESSRDNSSRGQISTLQGSYPDELMNIGRSNDLESAFPDPDVIEVQSDVESDAVFGSPTTYGGAGGDSGGNSPSIVKRGHAMENWRESVSPSESSPDKNKVGAAQILRFWTSGAASQEEQDEAIHFNETDQWLDRDPDLNGFRDDVSLTSDPKDKLQNEINEVDKVNQDRKPMPISSAARGVAGFSTNEPATPNSSAWAAQKRFASSGSAKGSARETIKHRSKRSGSKKKKEVFDPFGDTEGLKISNSDDLFSPLRDPFMTEESFSPPDWTTPRGNMSYYSSQSPDWQGMEI
jgi:hypothetical protein